MAPGVVLVGLKPAAATESPKSVMTSGPSTAAALSSLAVEAVEPLFQDATGYSSLEGAASFSNEAGLSAIYRVRLAPGGDVLSAVERLRADPAVAFAEPDYLAHLVATPTDPLYSQQWGLAQVDAPTAWDVTAGSAAVTIAVVDSGLDTAHADLSGQLWTNPGEIAANGLDDDNNGHIDDVNGWNFVNDDADLSDNTGHGTQVAGVIAAAANNGTGGAGVCWGCKLMVVKVTQVGGLANYSDIAAGVLYAAQKGAKVINLSLGGYADSATLRAAVEAASATAVVVGGAGNDNVSTPFYPAAYDKALAVAGTDQTDAKVSTSNYGAWVDVTAPGQDITTTYSGGGYGQASGTSVAAPFASGLAGLVLSQQPTWSPALVRAHIVKTAENVDGANPGYAGQLGTGRIDATAAMQPAQPLVTIDGYSVNGLPGGRPDPGSVQNSLTVQLSNDWLDVTGLTVQPATSDPYVAITAGAASVGDLPYGSSVSAAFTFDVSGPAGYAHNIALTLAVSGNAGTYTVNLPLSVMTRSAEEPVSGTLPDGALWTNDKIYVITGDVGVAPGRTLTILPGTIVRFNGNFSLNVGGTLIADGTAEEPIRFEAAGPSAWNQIRFDDTAVDAQQDLGGNYLSGSILRYVSVVSSTQGLACLGASPYLSHLDLSVPPPFAPMPPLPFTGGRGGIQCNAGNTPVQLRDSTITGMVLIVGQASIDDNDITSGHLIVNGQAALNQNTVAGGGISVGPGSTVDGNTVSGADLGLLTSGAVTVTANRLVDNTAGAIVDSGLFQGNLIANSAGVGLQVGAASVISNTFTGNRGNAIMVQGGVPATITGNNLEANSGPYDVYVNVGGGPIQAGGNWWGTTNTAVIAGRVFDFNEDYSRAELNITTPLAGPVESAPAYVRHVTISPDTTLGIQRGTFEVQFSRPMDEAANPTVMFDSVQKYQSNFVPLLNGSNTSEVHAIAFDDNGDVWFATEQGVNMLSRNGQWATLNTSNSGLPGNSVLDLAFDAQDNVWFSINNQGIAMLSTSGTWRLYTPANSLLACPQVNDIEIDQAGNKWFGCYRPNPTDTAGTTHVSVLLASGAWKNYTSSNSLLQNCMGDEIAVDASDNIWFGGKAYCILENSPAGQGVAKFSADGSWTRYSPGNSGLVSEDVIAIAQDLQGNMWFGSRYDGISVLSPSGEWTTLTRSNSMLMSSNLTDLATDHQGRIWIGTESGLNLITPDGEWLSFTHENGSLAGHGRLDAVAVQNKDRVWLIERSETSAKVPSLFKTNGGYAIFEDATWLSNNTWRAAFDVTSLIPRDNYSVTVTGAYGLDGMEIPADSRFTFTVDYAGQITDQTAPPAPFAAATGLPGDSSSVALYWAAGDPDSQIVAYRYAIGTAPGVTDIVSWTTATGGGITRNGLGLNNGQQYWVAVQAQNAGGLWSPAAYRAFTPGQQTYWPIHLPLVRR